ncbi:MAG: beta-N-acetylhexosaminidase [Pseudomonadota bacterium]
MTRGPLMVDVGGLTLTAEDKEVLAHPDVGSVILFSRNVDTPAQIAELTTAMRAVRPELWIAVDQEGGRVQRFREGFTRLPAMRQFGHQYDQEPLAALAAARACGELMAREVRAVGVDFSFAPVLDLDVGVSGVIGDRAFHTEPVAATALVRAFMQGMKAAGMMTIGKHFPGHGSVAADSHFALPVDDRSWAEIDAYDLQPFRALADELDGIMPAHVVYPQVDPLPAGFSSFWLKTVLREQLGFQGLIFSDDLCMEGAAGIGSMAERKDLALAAGCDVVLICNNRDAVLGVLS